MKGLSRFTMLLAGALLMQGAAICHGAESMNTDKQSIENIRAKHDSEIMSVEGVVSVGTGLGKDGQPCLVIGTSVPVEEVRARLPEEIFEVCVEITHVGEIKAQ